MRKAMRILLALLVCSLAWFLPSDVVGSPPSQPTGPVSGSIRCPEDYQPAPLEAKLSTTSAAASGGLKAVAIVGDVGGSTGSFIDDMEGAVDALQAHDVSVTTFYYGVTSFTWGDIVAAAQGAHFLLYMGHGVYGWGSPNNWGGFYLGSDRFVTPSMIRRDLDGVLAPDSIIIFSHACFTAGSSGSDASVVSQSTAEDRVRSYAEPFIDIGMEAYFANNYWDSAAVTVNSVLGADTMETAFKGGIGYSSAGLVDLSYPEPGYDLWLDKCMYAHDWNLSFVGIPDYVFQATTCSWPDVDCSGMVDQGDVQAVAESWRCVQGESCYQEGYDVDGDGIITVVDIERVAAEQS